ncbi:MAG: class I SAM-dependent methyltransferase, partial [Solirubrobacterales bacterium]
MAWARAALALGAVVAVALVVVSGGSDADPRTPAGLPGLPPPFLGTAVSGGGGLSAAVDAYGDVVDLRAPGPAGRALIDNPSARQAAGTVPAETGIVPRVSLDGGPALPLWRADSVSQRYLPGTNVVRTTARFGSARVAVEAAVENRRLALIVEAAGGGGVKAAGPRGSVKAAGPRGEEAAPAVSVDVDGAACRSAAEGGTLALLCIGSEVPLSRELLESQPTGVSIAFPRGGDPFVAAAKAIVARAAAADRAWLAAAQPLAAGSFDLGMCDHGAMSFCDPEHAVGEAARLLRPGGRLVFAHTTP